MAAPDPEGMSLLGKVVGAAVAIGTPIYGFFTLWNKKADKHAVNNQIQEIKTEQAVHRGYFKDVFKAMEDHARRDEELAREVIKTMAANHAEVLRELGHKADR